jgi:uncharacterized protein YbbC (DUF1343 family)
MRGNGTVAAVRTGLDILRHERFEGLRGSRLGLLYHPASVDCNTNLALDLFMKAEGINLLRLFGPQHGILGQTQDNMVEWNSFRDKRTGLECCSLYGQHRKPPAEMLSDLDVLVIDLQDVGARYYTFNWTMLLCMEACAEVGVKVMVLDRPNPINAKKREGRLLDMSFSSFVGMAPIPIRHGMTAGEIARMSNTRIGCDLEVVWMDGYRREMWFEETGLPWVMPSPNMPTLETAVVYPGMCLLEGTELSEGRGTTRPFEIFGAPYIDARRLVECLAQYDLPGVLFRSVNFEPTFQKHAGVICGGAQIHVVDRDVFRPVLTAVTILSAVCREWPDDFAWKEPPYEYETEKMPIDILFGGPELRRAVVNGDDVKVLADSWAGSVLGFGELATGSMHYE